ncbi:MAG: carboxypeptidase M32 [Candidatus Lokiarchaeota archaeon]|nr:carboxypeptidase M32 [Candidatus Lokiarchaeota archaeon]
MSAIKELWSYFNEIKKLKYIEELLQWDLNVNMPKGSIEGRAEQRELIRGLIHRKMKSQKVGELIKDAENSNPLTQTDLALIREAKREHDHAKKIPEDLISEIAKTGALGYIEWEKARIKSEFSRFEPYLEKMVSLRTKFAEFLNTGPTPYSSLIDLFEPGATYEWIAGIFNKMKIKLVKIIHKLVDCSEGPDQSILRKYYETEKQWQLSLEIIKKLNFNFNIGRQDKSTHPFTASVSSIDTRITTRIWEDFLPACLFGTIHECGHALYEMGFNAQLRGTYLADGCSMGMHESQSRLWENIVGRSREFWVYWYPILQKFFPENLRACSLEDFYRSINVVKPSFIRVEADEVTYGLHIILRFELEKMMIEDNLQVSELPQIWNTKFEELFGIVPPSDKEGVLQDPHWIGGYGYFPTYALGNLYGAQIYHSTLKDLPNLPYEYEKGEFSNLLKYLTENIYQYGKIYRAPELLEKMTGEVLNPDYFIKYVENKFYPIYGL